MSVCLKSLCRRRNVKVKKAVWLAQVDLLWMHAIRCGSSCLYHLSAKLLLFCLSASSLCTGRTQNDTLVARTVAASRMIALGVLRPLWSGTLAFHWLGVTNVADRPLLDVAVDNSEKNWARSGFVVWRRACSDLMRFGCLVAD